MNMYNSNYSLASMLSKAFATPSRPSKKSSVYIFSVSAPTLFSCGMILKAGFITFDALAAVDDLCFWKID